MKNKKSEPKAKVKIKNLKLHKETVENLSDTDAGGVRGGAVVKGTEPKPTGRANCEITQAC